MAVSAFLDQPAVRAQVLPLSVEQYQALGRLGLISDNVELLDGAIVEKMPRSPLHSATAQRLAKRLRAVIGPDFDVRQEQPMTCAFSEPEPDVAVVPSRTDDYAGGHPTSAELVIEVAVTSAEIDYQKRTIYAAAGVCEYWIVSPVERTVEIYSGPTNGDYAGQQTFEATQVAASVVVPLFKLDLAEFFPR